MTLEDQMEISALLGIPLTDLLDKAEDFVDKVHQLVRKETENPRQALILMAVAYLYHVKIAVKTDTNVLVEAYTALIASSELLSQLMQQEPAR